LIIDYSEMIWRIWNGIICSLMTINSPAPDMKVLEANSFVLFDFAIAMTDGSRCETLDLLVELVAFWLILNDNFDLQFWNNRPDFVSQIAIHSIRNPIPWITLLISFQKPWFSSFGKAPHPADLWVLSNHSILNGGDMGWKMMDFHRKTVGKPSGS
jgi:hypothetical protein